MKLHLRPDYKKTRVGGGGFVLKAEGVCLLSVAVIFGEVCRSAFLASIGGAG